MASRQEEKEARRRARLEEEAAEQRAASRRKRLQMVLGGVLAVGIIVGVAVAVLAGGGGDSKAQGPAQASTNGVKLPAQQITNIDDAVKAAGCTLTHPPEEGRGHIDKTFTESDYGTNPPTSGAHFPQWAQDGVYEPANTPPLGQLVHTLEHGRIDVQYKPGTSPKVVRELEALVAEKPYHMLLYQNPTGMKAQVAATTWTQLLTCNQVTPKTWDALRTFRDRYVDTGPEQVP